jgi:DNA methylase
MAWQEATIGRCRLVHGRAEDLIDTLENIQLVITSPPYNLGASPWPHLGHWKPGDGSGGKSKWRNGSDASNGTQYASHDDTMPWPAYVAWQHMILRMLWARLRPDGAIFYNHKPRVIGAQLWQPTELLPPEVILRQVIIWARPGGMNFNPTAFVSTHEWIMVLAKPDFRLKSKGASGLGDVWQVTPESNAHPAPFPLEIPRRILEATGAASVVDPFAGSFTTAAAAVGRHVAFVGSEKDPGYWRAGCQRIQALYDQGDMFRPHARSVPQQLVLA